MFLKDNIEKINELSVSPFDIIRVLLPLIDAQISFNYALATALPNTTVLLPSSMMDLAKITATELWRRMWDGFEQIKESKESSILNDFLSYYFILRLEDSTFLSTEIIQRYSPKKRDVNKILLAQNISKQILSYGFYRILQIKINISTYSDKSFQNIVSSKPLIVKGKVYEINDLVRVVENLKWRFDFINWTQTKFFKETLNLDELLILLKTLSKLRNTNNCICIPKKYLEKKFAKDIKKSRKEVRIIINKLCNENYTRLYPNFMDYLRKMSTNTNELDESRLKSLIELDNLAGPYIGYKPHPFLEIKGFIFSSLWLLHYLILENIFEKTEALHLRRGFSLDMFTEKVLISDGFKVSKNIRWIKLDPSIDKKSKLEINVVAYRNRTLLLIQCKSYGEQELKNKEYKIKRQAKFMRQVSEYLAQNLELLLEKVRKQNLELYNEINEKGLETIYPLLITEIDDLGVVHGCRVINILKFLTEIYYIIMGNLWNDLVKNKEAISIK